MIDVLSTILSYLMLPLGFILDYLIMFLITPGGFILSTTLILFFEFLFVESITSDITVMYSTAKQRHAKFVPTLIEVK
jgi:hypothetical protein